jgi:cytidylate kinase
MNTELPITAVEERFKELKNAYIYVGGNHEYFYKQKNITDDIDTLEMSSVTCGLAKNPRFRKIVKDKIAKIIRKHRQIIIEGRDTGSKILPNAQLKIYIEHDYESRVKNCSTHTKRESLYSMLV